MHPHSIIRSLQSSWPALIVTLTFVLGFMLDVSLAIKCYECDEFPGGAAANKKCPGGRLITYGSKFDACIVYRLNSGRIVFQQEIDSKNPSSLCSHSADFLKKVIFRYFQEEGSAMCCKSDECNKDMPDDFSSSESLYLEDFQASQAADASSSSSSGGQHHQQEPLTRSSSSSASATTMGGSSSVVNSVKVFLSSLLLGASSVLLMS